MKKGIDISKHQGDIDLAKLKNKIDFVIIRAGYSNTVDPKFERNYNLCKSLNIPCGAYWYSYALDSNSAKKEANKFLDTVKEKTFEYPLYIDLEDADGYKKKNGYNFNKSKEICETFCQIIEDNNYYIGVYASKSWFDTYLKGLDKYNKWIAHWANVNYEGKKGIGMHQYTSSLRLDGYNNNLDGNYSFEDFPSIIKKKKLNGFSTIVKTTKKTNEEIANEVLEGKWDNGEKRKEKLTNAGYDYNVIQNLVNKKLKAKTIQNKKYYTVKKNDNLTNIAKKYNTTLSNLKKLNPDIKNINKIYVGQKIRIK